MTTADIDILEHLILLSGWHRDEAGEYVLHDTKGGGLWFRVIPSLLGVLPPAVLVYDAEPCMDTRYRRPIHEINGRQHPKRTAEIWQRAKVEAQHNAAGNVLGRLKRGE